MPVKESFQSLFKYGLEDIQNQIYLYLENAMPLAIVIVGSFLISVVVIKLIIPLCMGSEESKSINQSGYYENNSITEYEYAELYAKEIMPENVQVSKEDYILDHYGKIGDVDINIYCDE